MWSAQPAQATSTTSERGQASTGVEVSSALSSSSSSLDWPTSSSLGALRSTREDLGEGERTLSSAFSLITQAAPFRRAWQRMQTSSSGSLVGSVQEMHRPLARSAALSTCRQRSSLSLGTGACRKRKTSASSGCGSSPLLTAAASVFIQSRSRAVVPGKPPCLAKGVSANSSAYLGPRTSFTGWCSSSRRLHRRFFVVHLRLEESTVTSGTSVPYFSYTGSASSAEASVSSDLEEPAVVGRRSASGRTAAAAEGRLSCPSPPIEEWLREQLIRYMVSGT
mmetsp:Transcript_10355/g.30767  ORF Transcript_10355/g.30767 Transcript_10355/m.30767 type:complete len:279 (+) Transcript_10355:76-912(+)